MTNLIGTSQTHTHIHVYSCNLTYRLRQDDALMMQHLVPNDASSHFTFCVDHVVFT